MFSALWLHRKQPKPSSQTWFIATEINGPNTFWIYRERFSHLQINKLLQVNILQALITQQGIVVNQPIIDYSYLWWMGVFGYSVQVELLLVQLFK